MVAEVPPMLFAMNLTVGDLAALTSIAVLLTGAAVASVKYFVRAEIDKLELRMEKRRNQTLEARVGQPLPTPPTMLGG